jgi:hypothetical protein
MPFAAIDRAISRLQEAGPKQKKKPFAGLDAFALFSTRYLKKPQYLECADICYDTKC